MPRPFLAAVIATIAAWVPPVVFGLRWPEYRAARDFISELGAAGAPDAPAVNLAFLAAGVLFVAACAILARASRGGSVALSLVSLVGWSYVVAALVPCDSGCPGQGSPTQALHNAAGVLGYLGGGIGLLRAARSLEPGRHAPAWLARGAGALAIAGLAAMGAPELADARGAVQRVVELGVFGWLLVEARALGTRHSC